MPSHRQRRRRPGGERSERTVRRYEITQDLDRRGVETLLLEIRLLARRYRVTLKACRVEPPDGADHSRP